ncbi:hypothetical protein [Sporosarcina sp. G11-34]|uniref:hypothetical protein n=1 Tax=Sporosarcina sp. G11-34 TaxID=2849605 RepID=UPI0022A9B221|nr:hypothetical protein [Sporosarcina sp. G11-34]MCZ2260101.1 hypothetical protein [Sporosarcina sp. G11-34]
MFILFQILVVFLILLLTSFAVPKLQPLLYTSIFLIFLLYLLTTVVFPFSQTYIDLFAALPAPFAKLLIGSALLFYMSGLISEHIAEAGYASFASMSHFVVKIVILTLWIDQTTILIDVLSSLIKK